MKKYIVIPVFLLLAIASNAQTTRYVNLELLGAYNLAGVSFDSRFSKDSKFGYKAGIGYGFSTGKYMDFYAVPGADYLIGGYTSYFENVIAVPINAYYLFGKGSHHLETGLGISPSYLYTTNYYANNSKEAGPGFGILCFARLVYRFEHSSKPFSISAGFDIPYSIKNRAIGLYPSISVGYRL